MKNKILNFDASTDISLHLDNEVMSALFDDLFINSSTDDSSECFSAYLRKSGEDWYCNMEAEGKSACFQFDMKSLLVNAFANVISQQKSQLYEYFRNEIFTKINIDVIRNNQDIALEHLDIITSFEKPDSYTVYKKIDDFYFIPTIVFLYKDTFENNQIVSVPITNDQLINWDMETDTLFDLAFESLDRRLVIENFNKEYNNNPEVNEGKIFYTVYDKESEDLYGTVYQNIYSAKLRQYIIENFKNGAFVSFPHPSIGFIWPADKLSVVDSKTLTPSVLSNKTYTFNNVIHFDEELSPTDKQMKKHLYYIPSDLCSDVRKCC